MQQRRNDIRGIVFDLDGTLYVSPTFAATIQEAATEYIAQLKRVPFADAKRLMAEIRSQFIEDHDEIPTLSAVCNELGGTIHDLHSFFQSHLNPENYLKKDPRVINLLEQLASNFDLYLFTNNNRMLTTRIIDYLGLNGIFRQIYAIDDRWKAKPDEEMLNLILAEAELLPSQALFVGDRYDVDLRLPEQRGCPVYLTQSIEQLLRVEDLLKEL